MARLKRGAIPGIRRHKQSGKAVVTLSGQDHYLGPHGTKVALAEYDRVVNEWLARGRRPLIDCDDPEEGELTLVELAAHYKSHAKNYYRKNGQVTSEYHVIVSILRVACEIYGDEPADSFDGPRLQAVQQAMVRRNWVRTSVNRNTFRLVKMFSWALSQKLIKGTELMSLREVTGLRQEQSAARESEPVLPVDEATIQATLRHLSQTVADMVKLQRLTGMRPEEVCAIRPRDVDTTADVWSFRPASHKTQHHGHERLIFIGPRGQEVLKRYLLRAKDDHCFSPAEAEQKRLNEAHEARITPIGCGNRPGTNRVANRKRKPGGQYTTASFRRAIHRACELAFEMPGDLRKPPRNETPEQRKSRLEKASDWRKVNCWSPNQLRHSAATEIRKRFDPEAAQLVLGHAKLNTTEIYAERNMAKAKEVMAAVG